MGHCLASPLAWPPAPGQLPLAWFIAWSVHWPGHHLTGLSTGLTSAATRPPPPGQLPLAWPPPPGQLPLAWPPPHGQLPLGWSTAWPLQRPGHLRLDNFLWPGPPPGLSTGLAATCLASAATRPPPHHLDNFR